MPKLAEHLTEDQVFNLRAYAKGQASFASLSPAEQQFVSLIHTVTDEHAQRGGRDMPFEQRTEHTTIYDAAGIDPSMHGMVDQAMSNIRDDEIAATLLSTERMGSDRDTPPDTRPPTLAETIEASIEATS